MKILFQLIIWQFINPALLRIKKGIKYKWNDNIKGLNIGCGIDNLTMWIGIDGGITHLFIYHLPKFISRLFFKSISMSKFYNLDDYYKKIKNLRLIYFDVRFGLPFRNEIIPYIYSSHFLEHLKEVEAEILLKECFRVMKAKAIIRIAVPSIDFEIEKITEKIADYNNGGIIKIQELLTTNSSGFIAEFSTHKYMYNFSILKKKLENAGFINVEECSYKKGKIIDVEFLDTREDSLFIEAVKP